MRKYITADINICAHKIKKALNISWKQAYNLTIRLGNVPLEDLLQPNSFLGVWEFKNAESLAGHFWGLHKAYQELDDKGRSYTMKNTAKLIYDERDKFNRNMSLSMLADKKGISDSVITEAFDFYKASYNSDITPRSKDLIKKGASMYYLMLKKPEWDR